MGTAAKLLTGQCSLAGITHHTCKCTYVHLHAHIHMFMCVCVVICKWNWNLSSLEFEWMFSIFLSILALIVTERCAASTAASTAASANSQFINVKCVCVSFCLPAPMGTYVCVWVSANWFCYSFIFLWQRSLRRCLPFTCYFLGLFLTERGQRAATPTATQAATATAARVSVRKIVSFSCSTFNLCIISAVAASFLMFCQQQNAKKKKNKMER